MSRKSARVSSPAGHSKSAEPPPETRKNTVSFSVKPETASMIFCVPRIVFSSGRGCPASRMVKSGISPFAWSYFVRTMPASILWGIFSAAAFAMFQAALPMAMTIWSIFFASDKISFTENAPLSFVYRFYICFFKYSKSEGKKQSKKAYIRRI